MPMINVICHHCGNTFQRTVKRVNEARKYNWKMFCSRSCLSTDREQSTSFVCTLCGVPVTRRSSTTGNVFCSSSCSASFNNKTPKRKRTNKCKICAVLIVSDRTYCPTCIENGKAQGAAALALSSTLRSQPTSRIANESGDYNSKYRCAICLQTLPLNNFTIKKTGRVLSWCKECNSKTVISKRTELKLICLNYLGASNCSVCGYDHNIAALEFHHNILSDKEFGIAEYKGVRLSAELKAELDKCTVVCSNCHRELHNPMFTQPE